MTHEEHTRRLSEPSKYTVQTVTDFPDGFTVTLATELEAYRFAHAWNHALTINVKPTAEGGNWLVQIYLEGFALEAHKARLKIMKENRD